MTDEYTLGLVRSALEHIEQPEASLVSAYRRAIRVARLRSDWEAVYWLSMELDNRGDPEVRRRRFAEVAPHFSREELKTIHERDLEESLRMRQIVHIDERGNVTEDKVIGLSVPEIDESIAHQQSYREDPLPTNLIPIDAAMLSEERRRRGEGRAFALSQLKGVRSRLLQRVQSYLSVVELQLARGQRHADYFDHNRTFVDSRLAQLAPEAGAQLKEALARAVVDTTESRSHALTSCRRVLKTLADVLYPARSTPVKGIDGKERVLDDSKFVARLWQYLGESATGTHARAQMQAELQGIGETIDRLNGLASKGVHDQVSAAEVSTCVTGLYAVVGVLVRLRDHQSAATADPDTFNGT